MAARRKPDERKRESFNLAVTEYQLGRHLSPMNPDSGDLVFA